MVRVVVHGLLGDPQGSRRGQRLPAARVAGVPGVGAAGDLEPDPVPSRGLYVTEPEFGELAGPLGRWSEAAMPLLRTALG